MKYDPTREDQSECEREMRVREHFTEAGLRVAQMYNCEPPLTAQHVMLAFAIAAEKGCVHCIGPRLAFIEYMKQHVHDASFMRKALEVILPNEQPSTEQETKTRAGITGLITSYRAEYSQPLQEVATGYERTHYMPHRSETRITFEMLVDSLPEDSFVYDGRVVLAPVDER